VAEPETPAIALIAGYGAPLMMAGEASAPRLYRLAPMERGGAVAGGGFRFSPARKNWQGIRLAAHLEAIAVPPDITVTVAKRADVAGRNDLFVGTRRSGVARLAIGKSGEKLDEPEYLPVGELALDARRLSVACLAPDLCLLATGAGEGWSWVGPDRMFQPIGARAPGHGLMALAGDGAGTVYSVAGSSSGKIAATGETGEIGSPGKTGKIGKTGDINKIRQTAKIGWISKIGKADKIARTGKAAKTDEASDTGAPVATDRDGPGGVTPDGLTIGRLSAGGAKWDPLLTVPVRSEGEPVATFATVSPEGNLWIGIRDRSQSGQEFGRGVIEVQLPSGRTIHHRPYQSNEERPAEAVPIAGDVTAVRFAPGSAGDPSAIWFCTSQGVQRFAGSDLSRWGENEGLDSESCHDLEIAADHTVWVATEAGVAHFDGQKWRRYDPSRPGSPSSSGWPVDRDGDGMAARALVAFGQGLWAGTPRGVWPLARAASPSSGTATGIGATQANTRIDRSSGLMDDDVIDLVVDRFGRLWVLGRIGLTVRQMPR
jgi:hypothetical protein